MITSSPLSAGKRYGAAIATLGLDRRGDVPMHAQLVRQIRQLILAGRLKRGSRMPSTRALALELGVSRVTVTSAYDQLASEGYLEGRRGSGVYVSPELPDDVLKVAKLARPAVRRPARLDGSSHSIRPYRPFQIGATDPALFPHGSWSRLLAKTWRYPSAALTGIPDSFGWPALRAAISHHLADWRGVDCTAEQIVITSGTADATDIIAQCMFSSGERVLVEEPGYPALRLTLIKLGLRVEPVRVDLDGFDLGAARRRHGAKGVFVTPSRQFPLGATLPLGRRLQLLEWVKSVSGYIVEDDFDSEYRYHGSPLPALMSLDGAGRVIYIGSFSKILSPTLRLGFVVMPMERIEIVRAYLRKRGTMAALTAQPPLAELIMSGDLAVHIRRTRRVYARRQAALLAAAQALEGVLELSPGMAGMHLVADLAPAFARRMTDRAAARLAADVDVVVTPLADYYALRPDRRALLLGFAGFSEAEMQHAAGRLARVLRQG